MPGKSSAPQDHRQCGGSHFPACLPGQGRAGWPTTHCAAREIGSRGEFQEGCSGWSAQREIAWRLILHPPASGRGACAGAWLDGAGGGRHRRRGPAAHSKAAGGEAATEHGRGFPCPLLGIITQHAPAPTPALRPARACPFIPLLPCPTPPCSVHAAGVQGQGPEPQQGEAAAAVWGCGRAGGGAGRPPRPRQPRARPGGR